MKALLIASTLCLAQGFHVGVHPTGAVSRARSVSMRSWTAADMQFASLPLPEEVESLLSADTDRKTTSQMWAAFSKCYETEDEAVEAAKRNTGTILPYLNSPSNIIGSYAYIVEELGLEQAREVCKQNPGVLQCDPRALRQTSGEEIARAAKVVDNFERLKLPPAIRNNLDKVLFFTGAGIVAKRLLIDCVDRACGGSPLP